MFFLLVCWHHEFCWDGLQEHAWVRSYSQEHGHLSCGYTIGENVCSSPATYRHSERLIAYRLQKLIDILREWDLVNPLFLQALTACNSSGPNLILKKRTPYNLLQIQLHLIVMP